MPAKKKPSVGHRSSRKPGPDPARGVTDFVPDESVRATLGVVVSLVKRPGGRVRVVLDDARRGNDGTWTPSGFFTSRDFPAAILRDMAIDPAEVEQTGLAVLARLIALEQVGSGGG